MNTSVYDVALLEGERSILARVAKGGPLQAVLRDLILLVEKPSRGEMLASILFLSEDGKHLLEGAAPSLPAEYNAAIHGLEIGPAVGSCGTAAYCGEPVYVADIANDPLWKDFRSVALKHGLSACWSIPIKAGDGRTLGTFANYYREPRAPTTRDRQVIEMFAHTAAIAIERHRDDVARAHAEEQRALLMDELNHRVKNAFSIAGSLVALGARTAADPKELAASVQGKLAILSRTHDVLVRRWNGADESYEAASFADVLSSVLEPYNGTERKSPILMRGPALSVSPRVLTSLALVFHELATNATKYGALSVVDGEVAVNWTVDEGRLRVTWLESNGPAVAVPSKTGFGSKLAQRTVERQLGGSIGFDWQPRGLRVEIGLPLSKLTPADTGK